MDGEKMESSEHSSSAVQSPTRSPILQPSPERPVIQFLDEAFDQVDAFGRVDAAVRIQPPKTIRLNDWIRAVEVAVEHYRVSGGLEPTVEALAEFDSLHGQTVNVTTWQELLKKKNWQLFMVALSVRGIRPVGESLTPQQKIAIEWATNWADHRTLGTKLKALGISLTQWNMWLKDRKFAEQYNLQAEKVIQEAAPAVTMALVHKATSGDMRGIEYFDKRAGRDPDKQEAIDGREVARVVVDVLSRHLARDYPHLLDSIASELKARLDL